MVCSSIPEIVSGGRPMIIHVQTISELIILQGKTDFLNIE